MSPYLARFDGTAWSTTATPPCEERIGALAVTPSGEQWASCGLPLSRLRGLFGEGVSLWSRPPGGAWQPQPLPGDDYAGTLVARDDGDVWVAGSEVYRSSTSPLPRVGVPTIADAWFDAMEYSPPAAGGCGKYVVMPLDVPVEDDHSALIERIAAVVPHAEDTMGGFLLMQQRFRGEVCLLLLGYYVFEDDLQQVRKALPSLVKDEYCAVPRKLFGDGATLAHWPLSDF